VLAAGKPAVWVDEALRQHRRDHVLRGSEKLLDRRYGGRPLPRQGHLQAAGSPALGARQDNLTVDITHFGATRKGINGIQSYAKSEDKKLTIFSADPAVMALDTTVDRHINCRKSDITVELPGDLGTNLEGDTATGARSVLPACPRSFSLPAEDLLPTLGRLASA
jgi:hypothetical protein